MFDREEAGREPPYGRVLDLGCGSGTHTVALAARGWQVTGINIIPEALDRAYKRADQAGVEVRLIHGDVMALCAAGADDDFRLVLDFGTVHGMLETQRWTVGREVCTVTAPDASLLMLAFAPGSRGPLPRGMSRADIEAAYPGWSIVDDTAQNGEVPWFLNKLKADPRWYRLRRE